MNTKITRFLLSFGLLLGAVSCTSAVSKQNADKLQSYTTDQLGISVDTGHDREYSFTNKQSAYYYGMAHANKNDLFFSGWNIAQKRIFSDYSLFADTLLLDRRQSLAMVYPYKLQRKFANATEDFYMTDNQNLLFVKLSDIKTDSVGISIVPVPEMQAFTASKEGIEARFQDVSQMLKVVPFNPTACSLRSGRIEAPSRAGGFLIVYGKSNVCDSLIEAFRKNSHSQIVARKQRMDRLLSINNPIQSSSDSLVKALDWILLTMDQLNMNQNGKGIYAGLPWFNEYWGRDMFISMPGACYVTGQFQLAKAILSNFARFQDTNPQSPTYGRIPNVVKVSGTYYNTTDGTPRFVMQVYDYLRYTGDTGFVKSVYPAVKLSISATLAHHTDPKGYLMHADAETWMDVMRKGIPGSPRANRANDVQALWYQQLIDGARMADYMHDSSSAQQWRSVAGKIKAAFVRDYCFDDKPMIADHLNTDGSRDRQYRPNQLFCFGQLDNDSLKMVITKDVWQKLVYPWGVSTLSQYDPNFHPQHENWHYYHKDDAYHNGTVWLWLNGIAMQRMIEMNQSDIAWQLFQNMNRQALNEAAVGSLSECADAHPRKGAQWANPSGTFLQAWSNAEHLRVWYQYFLGVRPDLLHHRIVFSPRLPSAISNFHWSEKLGNGQLAASYRRSPDSVNYVLSLNHIAADIRLSIPGFNDTVISQADGKQIHLCVKSDLLTIKTYAPNGTVNSTTVKADPKRQIVLSSHNRYFAGTHFCRPVYQPHLKAFSVYHKVALTY